MSWLTVLLIVGLGVLPAAGQDRLDVVAAAVDHATAAPAAEAAAVERMARFLGTTPDALHGDRAGTGLGWGDLFIAHRIAARGGHPVAKVFAARRTGAAWGTIAEEAGVETEGLVQDVASLWPDAGRPAPSPAAPEPREPAKGFGTRVLDVLRGSPSADPPADTTQEEIRDRLIRGGGRSR
ncbi:MAG TPA: hypothetical protein VGD07_17350 [Methylomirabilota bacterium]|jgi:hypothetical protein